ncbi:btb/poz domain-containing protein [Moumouvirus maliensis]|nr:btb/poz domain-containing protein [Moumouvirus maliensis]
MDDNTIINIKTNDGVIQTYFQTIKICQPLVDKIDKDTILVDIEYPEMLKFMNYLRGVFETKRLLKIAPNLKKIGIKIEKDGYVYINIGGKIFYLEKKKLEKKFDYFEMFFRRYESLHPDYSSILIDRCPIIFKLILDYHIYKIIRIKPSYINEDEKHFCINNFMIKCMDFKHITYIVPSLSSCIYEINKGEINTNGEYNLSDIKYHPVIFFNIENIEDTNILNKIEIIFEGEKLNTKYFIHKKNILYDNKRSLLVINCKNIINNKTSRSIYKIFTRNHDVLKIIIPKEINIGQYYLTKYQDIDVCENIITKKINNSNIIISPNDISSQNILLMDIKIIPNKKINSKIFVEIYFEDELVCKSFLCGLNQYVISGLRPYYNYKICLPSKNNFKIIFKFPENMEDKEVMFMCDYSVIDDNDNNIDDNNNGDNDDDNENNFDDDDDNNFDDDDNNNN